MILNNKKVKKDSQTQQLSCLFRPISFTKLNTLTKLTTSANEATNSPQFFIKLMKTAVDLNSLQKLFFQNTLLKSIKSPSIIHQTSILKP
jgi:hypothetical protein